MICYVHFSELAKASELKIYVSLKQTTIYIILKFWKDSLRGNFKRSKNVRDRMFYVHFSELVSTSELNIYVSLKQTNIYVRLKF